MAEVISFPGVTQFTIEPDNEQPIIVENVLQGAMVADLKEVIVLGRDSEGEFYLASSSNNLPSVMWLLEIAKFRVIAVGPD